VLRVRSDGIGLLRNRLWGFIPTPNGSTGFCGPYVPGTLKVPGVDPVTDEFLIDTGSDYAVNHPIIRKSKGQLRETNTGNGGFGESQRGVIGPNEWFRIGGTTIPNTVSACCAGSEDVNNQLGGGILSRFRITFDYPNHRIFLEK